MEACIPSNPQPANDSPYWLPTFSHHLPTPPPKLHFKKDSRENFGPARPPEKEFLVSWDIVLNPIEFMDDLFTYVWLTLIARMIWQIQQTNIIQSAFETLN